MDTPMSHSQTGAGRPPVSRELVQEVVAMIRDGVTPAVAVERMRGRMGQTKVYEIYRVEKRNTPDADTAGV
jgi:hypothetical protein